MWINLRKIYLIVFSNNERAISLYKKLGFKEESRLCRHVYKNGKYLDVINMAIYSDGLRYKWGAEYLNKIQNDGWFLHDTPNMSIIREKIYKGGSEVSHYHEEASQFFTVINGELRAEVNGNFKTINKGECLHILPKEIHRVFCDENSEAEFMLVSIPSTKFDRTNI